VLVMKIDLLIQFYIPKCDLPDCEIPVDIDANWKILYHKPSNGVYSWILQTYIRLKGSGANCQLVDTIPESGIIIAHRYSLPFHFKPTVNQFLICVKADHDRHPYAHLHVVQNVQEANDSSYYIPLWAQPGIIPRNPARGNKFENIAYFGIEKNLASQLQDSRWHQVMSDLGVNFSVVSKKRWNDYSEVDAVLAVRSFDCYEYYKYKPATKLYNSWFAGTPAILGRDSAFRNERQSDLDYLEVTSLEETIAAIKRLRGDIDLRVAMMENCTKRAQKFTTETILKQWRQFIEDVAVPVYYDWQKLPNRSKASFLAKRYLTIRENNLKPHYLYPHDQEDTGNRNFGITEQSLISIIGLYRQARRLATGIR
jgi:hypothetical protein